MEWDRDNDSWRGRIPKNIMEKLCEHGQVSEDGIFSGDDRIDSKLSSINSKLDQREKQLERILSEKKQLHYQLHDSPEVDFLKIGEPVKIGHHSESKHKKIIEKRLLCHLLSRL